MNGRTESRLIFPGLAGFYAWCGEIAYALVRIVIGYNIFMHGWVKVPNGYAGVAAYMTKNGLEPHAFFAGAAMFLETVGALCVLVGLFTR